MSLSTSMQSSTPNNVIGTIAVLKILTQRFEEDTHSVLNPSSVHITELSVAAFKPGYSGSRDAMTLSKFDMKYAELLLTFLQTLEQPVCLVAHNGRHYEFALLKAELDGWNLEMPPGTLCVDSLVAFYEIDTMREAVKRGELASFSKSNLQQDYYWCPPADTYGFREMYTRLFDTELKDHGVIARRDDIVALVVAYGKDFLKYAELRAIPFKAVRSTNVRIELSPKKPKLEISTLTLKSVAIVGKPENL